MPAPEPRAPRGPLCVLITNLTLASRTGTETYVRDLALGLARRGQRPVVYSPRLGAPAEELRAATVPVVDDLERIGAPPDLIHGHHLLPTLAALHHFPAAPGLFVCHDRLAWHDAPPRAPRLLRYVAVDDNCRDRLVLEAGLPAERVRLLLNWVDLERFQPRAPLPPRPRRALVFSNYLAEGPLLLALHAACARSGIELDVLGGAAGRALERPESVLPAYDVVFAKGRSALEALAVGAAVVLCGPSGLGPLVTAADFERLRPLNLGMRAITRPLTEESVAAELERYDARDAAVVSVRVRAEAGLERGLDELLGVYKEVLDEHRARPAPSVDEERRASARAFAALDALASRLDEQAAQIDALRRELRRVLDTPQPMAPLEAGDEERLFVEAAGLPRAARAGATLLLRVNVRNASGRVLCSGPPHPVQIGVRWWDARGRVALVDGPRTRLEPPLEPHGQGAYFVPAVAPPRAGAYRLRVSLVQEDVRWLDTAPTRRAEALVVVI